jgi:hypothetical protein
MFRINELISVFTKTCDYQLRYVLFILDFSWSKNNK